MDSNDHFIVNHEAKYQKAVACLVKDREALTAFFDFPGSLGAYPHHQLNRVDFATVRLRAAKMRGCVSRASMLAMIFILAKKR